MFVETADIVLRPDGLYELHFHRIGKVVTKPSGAGFTLAEARDLLDRIEARCRECVEVGRREIERRAALN
jgi:hypothetical protein